MIKSSRVSVKFSNHSKKCSLKLLTNDYRNIVSFFVDELWDYDKIPALIPKTIASKAFTWLSARMIQCAGKQASGIVRGCRKKNDARKFIITKLLIEGNY